MLTQAEAQIEDNTLNGWGKVAWGMNEHQVLAAYPEINPRSMRKIYYNSQYIAFTLLQHDAHATSWVVDFRFDSATGLLNSVMMASFSKSKEMYDSIVSHFRSSYGDYHEEIDSGLRYAVPYPSPKRDALWKLEKTNIRVSFEHYNLDGHASKSVYIHYTMSSD